MDEFRPTLFEGRNGTDQLSMVSLLVAVIIFAIFPVFETRLVRTILALIGAAALFYSLFRILSSNIRARQRENVTFLNLFSHLKREKKENKGVNAQDIKFEDIGKKEEKERLRSEARAERERLRLKRREDKRLYKYFKCPSCKHSLRVPRGKGKIKITCPECNERFIKRT